MFKWLAATFCVAAGFASVGVAALLAQQAPASGQVLPTQIPQVKFDRGQDVVPAYEGWIPNPDGSFDMVFGYFNRNYKEELAIPAGPANNIEPGGPDRGQPTYFLPRRQARIFRITVPKDWGKKDLIWTITANGRTEKAYGDLQPDYEISERLVYTGGSLQVADPNDPNRAPTLTISPVTKATVSSATTLTAIVSDDGLPKPRVVAEPVRPTTTNSDGTIARQNNSAGGGGRPRGLAVRWFQYGGPAKVTFEPSTPVSVVDGRATVTARFAAPGTYKLIAIANDGQYQTPTQVSITVGASSGEGR